MFSNRPIYRLICTLAAVAALLALAGCGLFGVTPASNSTSQPSSSATVKNTFGFDIHNPLQHWPSVPFTSWRVWDSTVDWPRVETSRGVYNWSLLDQYVALAQQHNVQLIYVLGNTPQWAATNPSSPSNEVLPGASSTLTDINDWKNFVQAVATRYKGKIQAYEVWNEVDLVGYWTGTMDQMLQMVQIAYQTIKQIDPSALVLAPSLVAGNGPAYLSQFMAAGGAQFTDAIPFHLYNMNPVPEQVMPFYQSVLSIAQQYNKPVWDTEMGWGPWGTFTDEEAAAFVARALVLQTSLGINHILWYAWDDRGPWVNLFLVQPDLTTPTLAGTAFGQVTKWLQNSGVSCVNEPSDQSWQCTLTASGGATTYIVWNPLTAETFSIPSGWNVTRMVDLQGNVQPISGGQVGIGGAPILLEP